MGLRFCPLFSGSDGNCCFLEVDNRRYLIDSGFSGKKVEENLKKIGVHPSTIDLIFITHEHIDHIRSAGILSRRHNIKLCTNIETWKAMLPTIGKISDENIVVIDTEKKYKFKLFDLNTVRISHDCANGLGYIFDTEYGKVSLLTDTGIITAKMKEHLVNSRILYFEANHDEEMLIKGPYDYNLKQRILSEKGHISNITSAKTLCEIVTDKCEKVYLGHLSETNNRPELAYRDVFTALEKNRLTKFIDLEVADRFENSKLTVIE